MHDCIACGCACYCHGDIDDCQVETIEYACDHCETCGCGEDEFMDSDYDYDDEPQAEPAEGSSTGSPIPNDGSPASDVLPPSLQSTRSTQ
jgi:hypothetical protein